MNKLIITLLKTATELAVSTLTSLKDKPGMQLLLIWTLLIHLWVTVGVLNYLTPNLPQLIT